MPHRDERSEWRGDALESTRTAVDRANGEEMAERVRFAPNRDAQTHRVMPEDHPSRRRASEGGGVDGTRTRSLRHDRPAFESLNSDPG